MQDNICDHSTGYSMRNSRISMQTDINAYCANRPRIYYNRLKTDTVDPSITTRMRYSQVARNNKYITTNLFLGTFPLITNITYSLQSNTETTRNIILQYETDIDLGRFDTFAIYWTSKNISQIPSKFEHTILTQNNTFTIRNVSVGKTYFIFVKVNLMDNFGEYQNTPLVVFVS